MMTPLTPYIAELKLAIAAAVLATLAGMGVYIHVLKADNRALSAGVAPLKAAASGSEARAEGYRKALATCEQDKVTQKQANDKAVADAQRAAQAAQADAEAFYKTLQHPPADCASLLQQVHVCPALMGY